MSDAAISPYPNVADPRPGPAEPRLRLWPGLLIGLGQLPLIFLPGFLVPGTMAHVMAIFWGPMIAAALFVVWWLFFSRAPWLDRVVLLAAFVAAAVGAGLLAHEKFRVGLSMYGLPGVTALWAVWMAISSWLEWTPRRVGAVAVFLLGWGACTLVRLDGIDGAFSAEVAFRWSESGEDRFLASREAAPAPQRAEAVALSPGDWPGFRGAGRDGRLAGVRIDADWSTPPRELWRRKVGPGWSSFAVVGDRLYTQEQRGPKEAVVCYHAETGKERWVHEDAGVRFDEPVAGPGPRATPTFHAGKVYAFGAKGLLNCLDAATGDVVWTRDVQADSGAKEPQWGFSSSPLVARGLVSVFAGGPDGGKAVFAYDAATGKPAWHGGDGVKSYSSPQLSRLAGVEQILAVSDERLEGFDPSTGEILWAHEWPAQKGMIRCTQPAVVGDDVLAGTGFGAGTRRLKVAKTGDGWSAEEVWTSTKLNPYYNDFVVHDGHLYGFDGAFFTCVSLDGGESRWRARGYGSGQVLLLAEQGLLLVLAEKGDVALLKASPEKHTVLGKFKAVEGKTWNHPVVAHGKLFVRNGEEMACFEMRPAK